MAKTTLDREFLSGLYHELEALREQEKNAVGEEENAAIEEGYELLSRKYLEEVLRREMADATHAYEGGERLSYDDWRESAVSESARSEAESAAAKAVRTGADEHALSVRGRGHGSGYGEYLSALRREKRDRALEDASRALAESYGEFYDDLENGESGASLESRLKTVSYIASHGMTEREGLLYALAAGLSYEEAATLAEGAVMLSALLDRRYKHLDAEEDNAN